MIAVRNISLRLDGQQIFSNFTLQLPERGCLCLSGPSGCGKTTLARVFARLQPVDSGTVSAPEPGQSAVMFQENRLLPWLTAAQNIAAALPRGQEQLASEWLHMVELSDAADSYPAALSGGMQRRVALARALAYGGQLLILDEPFQGMDRALCQRLYALVRAAAEDRPVLVITHQPDEAAALGRTIMLSGPPLRRMQTQPDL